jgi:hypothetical protein
VNSIVSSLVVKPRPMKFLAKGVELLKAPKYEAAASNIVHAGKLHLREPMELVEYGPFSFMTLRNRNVRVSGAVA